MTTAPSAVPGLSAEEKMMSADQSRAAASERSQGPNSPAPSLREIAAHVPLGHCCRTCGTSTYNVLCRLSDYLTTGKPCCPSLAKWIEMAEAGERSVNDKHNARMRLLHPERYERAETK